MATSEHKIVMVQHYPATGDYIVHRVGQTVETYSSEGDIQGDDIHRFIRECLSSHLFHECTVHLATGKVNGAKTLPVKQILYCKSFDGSPAQAGVSSKAPSNINWALWEPNKYELTVNRGMLGISRTLHMRDLRDAPDDVRDFMEACMDGQHIALSQHYSEPDRSSGTIKMVNISEYFFSTGKVIYGFAHERVQPVTMQELRGMGLGRQ